MDEDVPEGSLDLGDFGDDGALDLGNGDDVPIAVDVDEKGPTRFQMIEYMNQREWCWPYCWQTDVFEPICTYYL